MVFEKDAATFIQSHSRIFVQFSKFLISLDSSITIQTTFRSFSDRKAFATVLSAVLVLQCAFGIIRLLEERGNIFGGIDHNAACEIQRRARGVPAREAFKLDVNSRSIQSAWRRKHAVDELRWHLAARKVQTVWRGKTDRDWYALESAARTIQANWCGAVTRQIVSLS
jgi:hypothetical protein